MHKKWLVSKIVSNQNNRLRFRLGAYCFSQHQGYYIENTLIHAEGIETIRCNHHNGSIVITHPKQDVDKVIDHLYQLLSKPLKEDTPSLTAENRSLSATYQHKFIHMTLKRTVMRLLAPPVVGQAVLYGKAVPFILNGIKSLLNRKINVDVLDATSIGVSLLRHDFSTAGSVMYLLNVSSLMEDYTRNHAENSLKENLALNIEQVWLCQDDNQEILVPYESLKIGDTIHIRQGSMIPIDGIVTKGDAMINEASMTGESTPAHKYSGVTVYAGTVIEDGDLFIEVTALTNQSRIANIVHMIESSETLKASVQSRAENLADRIVPYSGLAFLATLCLTRNINRAVSVLMVDYSCALKLTVPICVISAMRDAAAQKMVIKGGKYFEKLSQSDTIVFDKTGTLTKAQPKVAKILAFGNNYTRDDVLRIAACLEEHFPHSLAKAIIKQAQDEKLNHEVEEHAEVNYVVAHGVSSTYNGEKALIGSAHFIYDDEGIKKLKTVENKIKKELFGLSVIYLSIGTKVIGAIGIEDEIRPEAAEIIKNLKTDGFNNIIMLTGDNHDNAKRTADLLGIDKFYAEVLPDDKARIIQSLKKEGACVTMVGDGINDSPALSEADISIAMDDACDIAKETADISLLSNNLNDIITLRALSNQLFNRIETTNKFIVGFNSGLIGLGMLGIISPNTAALLHNGSTVALSATSMRPYTISH